MCALQFMQISGYTDKDYQKPISGDPYSFMINPDSVKWQRKVEYTEEQAPDSSTPSQRYKYSPNDTLSFEVVIDCTGIVDSKRTDMAKETAALENIVFTYNGEIHRPNFVITRWGQKLTFKGVLTSFDTSYTLFKPDGSPLRAKISLGFSQYVSPATRKKNDKDESPDVSHLVNVEEGMTLPQLCDKVWNDDSYCVQVARFNDLNKFRNLKGIQKLIFPPIIQPS
jgi:Contractile injection system tube protein